MLTFSFFRMCEQSTGLTNKCFHVHIFPSNYVKFVFPPSCLQTFLFVCLGAFSILFIYMYVSVIVNALFKCSAVINTNNSKRKKILSFFLLSFRFSFFFVKLPNPQQQPCVILITNTIYLFIFFLE